MNEWIWIILVQHDGIEPYIGLVTWDERLARERLSWVTENNVSDYKFRLIHSKVETE